MFDEVVLINAREAAEVMPATELISRFLENLEV